jgi:hypothetical protein
MAVYLERILRIIHPVIAPNIAAPNIVPSMMSKKCSIKLPVL